MANNISNVGFSDYSADQSEIDRRRKMAEALQAQSMQPIEQQTAAGYAIPISWTQGLAKALQAYSGSKGVQDADAKQRALAERVRTDRAGDMQALVAALAPKPAQAPATPNDDEGNPNPMVAGSPGGRIDPAVLSSLRTPEMQNSALSMWQAQMARDTAAPTKVDLGDKIGLMNGQGQIVGYLPKGATPDAQLRNQTTLQTHQTPSGSAILQNEGANTRHLTPSGSAVLGSQTQLQTHATPSGSSLVAAQTARRGQDMGVNPDIQSALAQARAAGTEFGRAGAQNQIDLPQATAKAEQASNLIDQMIGDLKLDKNGNLIAPPRGGKQPHPGFSVGVGASMQPFAQYIPGTDKAGFQALLDQVKGGAFLQAFETLKGGGQITEVEGRKATEAITRMNTAQSEAEFVRAAREFQDSIRGGLQRAKQRATPQRRASDAAPVMRFDAQGNPI